LRQLLRHQRGLPEYFDADTKPPAEPVAGDQLLDSALARRAQFAPGGALTDLHQHQLLDVLPAQDVRGFRPPAFTNEMLTFCEHTMRIVCVEPDVELVVQRRG
jgi:D-alanyl-D-alanine carboxypeptidase